MIWKAIMEKLEKLYEGKAKQLYATDDPEVLWVESCCATSRPATSAPV